MGAPGTAEHYSEPTPTSDGWSPLVRPDGERRTPVTGRPGVRLVSLAESPRSFAVQGAVSSWGSAAALVAAAGVVDRHWLFTSFPVWEPGTGLRVEAGLPRERAGHLHQFGA